MPEKKTLERARRARRKGKPATTQAGAFVREEMEHVKRGEHPVKSRKQAVAIGLSKARRAGVDLPPPETGRVKTKTKRQAEAAYRRGQKSGELRKGSRGRASEPGSRAGKRPRGRGRRPSS